MEQRAHKDLLDQKGMLERLELMELRVPKATLGHKVHQARRDSQDWMVQMELMELKENQVKRSFSIYLQDLNKPFADVRRNS